MAEHLDTGREAEDLAASYFNRQRLRNCSPKLPLWSCRSGFNYPKGIFSLC
jgi:hypothetical protein